MLAGKEREASVELVAHLAALDSRPALYAAQGYGSLFTYCTQALRLSEDAACNRIEAARACRRFPQILELLASGSLTLTSVRLLARHLTAENHQSVLAKARDLPSAVRKLPCPKPTPPSAGPRPVMTSVPSTGPAIAPAPSAQPATPRPIVQAWAPERYRVQFTIGPETHEKLRRLQALLRREIPDGKTRPALPHVPREVKRAVWRRDAGQCAFVSSTGRRCDEGGRSPWGRNHGESICV